MNRRRSISACALLAALAFASPSIAQSITPTFTYQGELADSGTVVSGAVDLQFSLWTAASGGTQIGVIQEALGVSLIEGKFAVELNFQSAAVPAPFDGTQRWLEISVRPAGSGGAYSTLNPRQSLTATPYSSYATNAGTLGGQPAAYFSNAANLTGTLPDARLSTNVIRSDTPSASMNGVYSYSSSANTFRGSFTGNGTGLSNLNASSLTVGTLSDSRLSGNVATRNSVNTFAAPNTFNGSTTFNATANFTTALGTFNGSHVGDGSLLAGLNAANIASGTLDDARLSANVARRDIGQTFAGVNTFSGNALFGSSIGVGAGIVSPAASLQVVSPNYVASIVESASAAGTWFDLRNSSVGGRYWQFISTGNGNGGGAGNLLIGHGAAPGFQDLSALLITPAGNVGIGTLTPAAKLDVNGSIKATSVQFPNGTTQTSGNITAVQTNLAFVLPQNGGTVFNTNVPGAAVGDAVIITPGQDLVVGDVISYAWVNAPNSVRWRLSNTGNADHAYAATTWKITVIK